MVRIGQGPRNRQEERAHPPVPILSQKEKDTVKREEAHPAATTSAARACPATIAGGARAGRHVLVSFAIVKV